MKGETIYLIQSIQDELCKSIEGKWCKYLMFKFIALITMNFEPIVYQI